MRINHLVVPIATATASLLLLACEAEGPVSGLIISDVTLVSPERTDPLEHAYVRILDGRIAEVSDRPLRGEEEIDGSGRYLIPGLIDSHVHLAVAPGWPASMTPEQAAADPDVVTAALGQDPKSYLYFGFTTVVDLVGTAERTARWNAYEARPDAHFCGAIIPIDGEFRIALTPRFSYGVGPQLDSAEYTAESSVARVAADGATCVKTVYDSYYPMSLEQALALVTAAHAHDLPVFMHANRKADQAFAVAAGVDVIAHGMWRNPEEDAALDDEALEILGAVARERIGYQPTTQVIVGLIDMFDEHYLARPELEDVYPRVLMDWYQDEIAGRNIRRNSEERLEVDALIADRRRTVERATEVTAILAGSDARLLFGSDTPSDLIHTNPPGLNGRLEMDNWIASGVSEEKLFQALTIDNARLLHLDDQIGTIEEGKVANLVLLGANPLASVEAYDTIETVFLHGRPIGRSSMSARQAVGN